jgi:hypothetical protein
MITYVYKIFYNQVFLVMLMFVVRLKNILLKVIVLMPLKVYVNLQYYHFFHRFPNLNYPSTISEILVSKKFLTPTHNEMLAIDKYTSKVFLKDIGYGDHTVPTIDVVDHLDDIKWDTYQVPYIVKVSNGYNQNLIIHSPVNHKKLRKTFKKIAVKLNYLKLREHIYESSKRRFIIEPFLSENGHPLNDYKFLCFHGKVHYIQINDQSSKEKYRQMLDADFNYFPYPFMSGTESDVALINISILKRMKTIAEDIATHFDFIRVDFYYVHQKIYIGELTLSPMGGYILRRSPFLDLLWGKQFSESKPISTK